MKSLKIATNNGRRGWVSSLHRRPDSLPDRRWRRGRLALLAGPCLAGLCLAGWVAGAAGAASPPSRLTVGRITVESRDIFAPAEIEASGPLLGLLRRSMNGLHTNTRQHVLRRELLFAEGDPFDPADLAETERNLREMGFLNRIRVTPTDTTAAGRVNVLVSVRESWSLQTNLTYARSSGGDTRWTVQASEKNFLGYGTTLGAGVGADENSSYWNLWLRQRRISRLGLLVGIDFAQRADGHYRNVFVKRPFYAQDDAWGFQAMAWDDRSDSRFYLSNAGPAGIDPGRAASLYARLPSHLKGVEMVAQWRISPDEARRIWRLGGGLRLTRQDIAVDSRSRWELSDGRFADLRYLALPGQPLAREQGDTVFPFLWVQLVGRRWAEARFVLQYGPTEDIPLDLSLNLRTGPNGPQVGSTTGFGGTRWLTELEASRWWRLGPGLGNLTALGVWQAGAAGEGSHQFSLTGGWVGRQGPDNKPWITRVFAEYAGGHNLPGNLALVLGLGRGLRTLQFDGMAGDRLVRWNVEQGKATDWEVLGLFRLGAALFYDGGCAWWDGEDRSLGDARHEAGCGLRLGPTRSASTQVSRLDVSWALDGSEGPVFTATTRGLF